MEKKTIGSFIAALRKSTGLTQRELANRLNVSDKAVSRWERDECAPDLSLVPAIAEILGVTSEEIIRGERLLLDPESMVSRGNAKTGKQIERILKSTTNRFRASSMISIGITVLGFLLVLFINQIYGLSNVAGYIGSAVIVAAILFEIALFILSYSKIDDDDFRITSRNPFKYRMIKYLEAVLTLNIALFSFCLPLFGAGSGRKIPLDYWLIVGFLIAMFVFVSCLVVIRYIRSILIKRGIYTTSDEEMKTKKKVAQLGLISIVVVLMVVIGTIITTSVIRDSIDFEGIFMNKYTFDNMDQYKDFRAQYPEDFYRSLEYRMDYRTYPSERVEVILATESEMEKVTFYSELARFLTFIPVLAELAAGTIIYVKKRVQITNSVPAK